MLVTTRNVDPRAPDLAPALRNGQTLWTFPLQKAQWASNVSNDTDLCYPDTASLEKRIDKVSNDELSVDRLLRPRSLRPPVRPKFLWEQFGLSMQACNSQPSSKAKKSETVLLGRLFSTGQGLPPTTKSAVKLVTIPFALPPFVLEPMHYQCLCKSSIHVPWTKHTALRPWPELRRFSAVSLPSDWPIVFASAKLNKKERKRVLNTNPLVWSF